MFNFDESLKKLAKTYPRQAKIIELRFFGEMTLEEIGAALELSLETVKLDWRFACAWLSSDPSPPDEG